MSARARKAELFIAALLSNKSIEEASKKAGISTISGRRWLRDAQFVEQFRRTRQEVMKHVVARVQRASAEALDTLCHVQMKGDSDSVRVTAAKAVLDLAFKVHELEEIEQRIEKLERQAENNNEAGMS